MTDKIKKLRQETQKDVRPALEKGAQEIVALMKSLVPDGAGTGERDLKGTIRYKFGAAEGGGSDSITGRSASTRVSIMAGNDRNPEARWVEFGTAPHINGGKYEGSENPGTTARPYFFPSYRALRKRAKNLVQQAIKSAIRNAAAK